ncbi:MAG: hypothetical protein ACKO7W_12740 [Elainella sp.]
MDIREQLNRQRVKHIVSSYALDGNESYRFEVYLEELLQLYPCTLIELALVETLLDHWLVVPLVRGTEFLTQAHAKLKIWQEQPIASTITPAQFQQIAGLDPSPIFGGPDLPLQGPANSPVRPF